MSSQLYYSLTRVVRIQHTRRNTHLLLHFSVEYKFRVKAYALYICIRMIHCKNVPYALQFVNYLFREHELFFFFAFFSRKLTTTKSLHQMTRGRA